MAEEGIMVDSSCCHRAGGGGVKGSSEGGVGGGGTGLFVNGPLASLDPPPPIQACSPFVERGWEPRNLAASG